MKHSIISLIVGLLVFAGGFQVGPRVKFVRGDDKIDVMIGGEHFTSYRYEETLTKPVLYPVKTPSGIVVNRSFPLAKVEGESDDHPHHVGVFFTYDRVNDDGFWNNATSPPQVKHVKVTKMKGGAGKGRLSTVMHWVGISGRTLLEERRDSMLSEKVEVDLLKKFEDETLLKKLAACKIREIDLDAGLEL